MASSLANTLFIQRMNFLNQQDQARQAQAAQRRMEEQAGLDRDRAYLQQNVNTFNQQAQRDFDNQIKLAMTESKLAGARGEEVPQYDNQRLQRYGQVGFGEADLARQIAEQEQAAAAAKARQKQQNTEFDQAIDVGKLDLDQQKLAALQNYRQGRESRLQQQGDAALKQQAQALKLAGFMDQQDKYEVAALVKLLDKTSEWSDADNYQKFRQALESTIQRIIQKNEQFRQGVGHGAMGGAARRLPGYGPSEAVIGPPSPEAAPEVGDLEPEYQGALQELLNEGI